MTTCTTLNVEHLHSNIHLKERSLTPLDYARAFPNTVTQKNVSSIAHFTTTPAATASILHLRKPSSPPCTNLRCPKKKDQARRVSSIETLLVF